MNDSERLDFTLDQVAQRVGDPAPLVFQRLFAEAPELQALFCNDASGAVRAEMFLRALECLQDAASVAGILITTEAAVADAPKKASGGGAGGGDMGGMGGMGGMDF